MTEGWRFPVFRGYPGADAINAAVEKDLSQWAADPDYDRVDIQVTSLDDDYVTLLVFKYGAISLDKDYLYSGVSYRLDDGVMVWPYEVLGLTGDEAESRVRDGLVYVMIPEGLGVDPDRVMLGAREIESGIIMIEPRNTAFSIGDCCYFEDGHLLLSEDSKGWEESGAQYIYLYSDESDDFVLPDSSTREHSRSELEQLSNWELYLARNEIFARHGFAFKEEELSWHFSKKSWYEPVWYSEEFYDHYTCATVETHNVNTMLAIEHERNSPWAADVKG